MERKRKQSDSNDILETQQKRTKTDCMNYISVLPRLDIIAVAKVATMLCRLPDIRDAVMQHPHGRRSTEMVKSYFVDSVPTVNNILNKLSLLPLPNLIKAKMPPVIRSVVIQTFQWLDCICTKYGIVGSIGHSIINSLCCTSQGIVDRAKTLKQLIESNYDPDLLKCEETAKQIYDLACTYCLEDIISSLWQKLMKETKDYYLNDGLYDDADKHLIAYWSFVNNNELSRLFNKIRSHPEIYNWKHSIYKNMFSLALFTGNIVAVKYFWDKLTAEEIMCNLEQWVNEAVRWVKLKLKYRYYQGTNEYADILFFLLSKLSAETQKEVIQKNIHVILKSSFLFWPYQRFLLPIVQTVWESLNEESYHELLLSVVGALHNYKDKVYTLDEFKTTQNILKELHCNELETTEHILIELCRNCPINLKQWFIHNIIEGWQSSARCALSGLLKIGDTKTVKEMMSYANAEEQKKILIETFKPQNEFRREILEGNLNFIDQLMQETSLSEWDIVNLKEEMGLKWGSSFCYDWFIMDEFEMVQKFLNWAFKTQEKINFFKYKVMDDKIDITYQLFKEGDYDKVNRFVSWCCCSEQEINQFKKNFAFSKPKIIKVCQKDWCLFEKFIAWSTLSEEEINRFKVTVKQYAKLKQIVCLALEDKHFQFVDKLISWFSHSNKEIQQFKEECVLSGCLNWTVIDLFQKDGKFLKKVFNLFFSVSKEVKIKLKENISKEITKYLSDDKHTMEGLSLVLDVWITEDGFFNENGCNEVSEALEFNSDEVNEISFDKAREINSDEQRQF